jgi:hypothetical protein
MSYLIFFIVAAVLLLGLVYLIWRFWFDYANVGPEVSAFERDVAELNDAQANRISDEQLTRPLDTDSSWQIMVRRGSGRTRRNRRPRRR